MKVDDPMKTLNDLETEASWLAEGERIEVMYGEFWRGETPRTDEMTGKTYKTKDFKIGCKNDKGEHVFRYVNKYDMKAILQTFKDKTVGGKVPQSVPFVRPESDRGYGGYGRGRRSRRY